MVGHVVRVFDTRYAYGIFGKPDDNKPTGILRLRWG
jgi:hypothetical protein